MKKKAIVMTRFPYESSWGGEESHTINLAKSFREKGFEVIFMGSCPILLDRFQKEGFQTKKVWAGRMIVTPIQLLLSFFTFPFMIWSLRKAWRSITREADTRALYCLSLNEKIFLTPVALRQNVPVTWVEHQEIRNWLLRSPWKWLFMRHAKKVMISPISKKNERILKDQLKISPDNISFIINGVAQKDFQNHQRRTQPGLIVAANRFIPKKGLMDFLQAIEIMGHENEREYLVIGDGEQENELKKFIKSHLADRKVTISNFLKKEKWIEVLSQADIYVSCARDTNETFSLNTAEALASGCKVVVTHCSGIADFLQDNEEAIICDPQNPEALAKAIEEALSTSEHMRSAAQKVSSEKFDQQKMHEEYHRLILRHDP